jgi:hypothetical protein
MSEVWFTKERLLKISLSFGRNQKFQAIYD